MKIFKDIRWVSLIFLFVGMFIMSLFVTKTGDDFFYATFTNRGAAHFFEATADHYIHSNGRCIVHIFAALFLKLPHIFWVIINSAMWIAIVMNIYKIVNIYIKRTSKLKFAMFMLCGAFLSIHIEMAKESTLWVTGSFNYTYPLMMFTWYWYLLFTHEKQSLVKLCIVGFLAAASMEQESALAVMLTVGYIGYYRFVKKENVKGELYRVLIVTVIGAVSLYLAPGNLNRMNDEFGDSNGLGNNILSGFDFMLNYCISSNYMVLLNAVFVTACALYTYKKDTHILLYLLPVELFLLFATNHSGDFESTGGLYTVMFVISRLYYFTAMFSGAYIYFWKKKNPTLLIWLAFGVFSCTFIVFSPTLGPRVILFYEVSIIVSTVLLLAELVKKQTLPYAIIHLVVFAFSVWNVVYVTGGFVRNREMYRENEILIEKWKRDGGELIQKQYRNDAFEHSMPYNSEYHEGRYKEFFEIPLDTNIIWK